MTGKRLLPDPEEAFCCYIIINRKISLLAVNKNLLYLAATKSKPLGL